MAHDATFVAGIRQVRDDVLGLICDGNMLRSEISDQRWHQFDFEGHSCLECGQQPSGLLRIVEHQLAPSTIEPSDSASHRRKATPCCRVTMTTITAHGRTYELRPERYWHLTPRHGSYLLHNAFVGQGVCWSTSAVRREPRPRSLC